MPKWAKAKPVKDSGTASGITYLRWGKKPVLQQNKLEGEVRLRERNDSADTKVSEEEGGGHAPSTGAEIPLQPMEKTMMR